MLTKDLVSPATTVSLADYTGARLIVPRLRGRDPASVIHELSQALHREGWIPDLLTFYHAALNREYLASSELEGGLAFPHALVPGLMRLVFAFGRSSNGVSWRTRADPGVHFVLLIAVPATEATHYLSLISGLALLRKQGHLLDQLLAARDAFQILEVLKRVELRNAQAAVA